MTYTLPGDSILPSTDWERLLFGLSLQSLLALGDQPQAPRLSFLSSSSWYPPTSLSGAGQSGMPRLWPCFPGTVYLALHRAAMHLGAFFPNCIAYAQFLPWLSLKSKCFSMSSIKHTLRREGIHSPITQSTSYLPSGPMLCLPSSQ